MFCDTFWCRQGGEQKMVKVVGVFYRAFEYAKDPKFLGCAENALGLREFVESKGHEYIVTDDKDGDNCGEPIKGLRILNTEFWYSRKRFRFLDGFRDGVMVCGRVGEAHTGYGDFDHYAVSPGVHDPGATEQGEDVKADIDGRRGIGSY